MPQELFASFEILELLASGLNTRTYKVRDTRLDRVMALQTFAVGDGSSEHQRRYPLAKVQVMASLEHPGIVRLHEVGRWQEYAYLLMEFVEGGSLDQKLDCTPWPVMQAAELVEKLAGALHTVHQRGIVHRDVKPAHVLLTKEGLPKLTGFGLARLVGQIESGAIAGTANYMPPEQATGQSDQVGPASDVYSLGTILYELLTGRRPFNAGTVADMLVQVVKCDPVQPTKLQPQVPRDLEAICLKCLAKQPGGRYQTAAAMAQDLRRFLSGSPVMARPPGLLERGWRRCAGLLGRRDHDAPGPQ